MKPLLLVFVRKPNGGDMAITFLLDRAGSVRFYRVKDVTE